MQRLHRVPIFALIFFGEVGGFLYVFDDVRARTKSHYRLHESRHITYTLSTSPPMTWVIRDLGVQRGGQIQWAGCWFGWYEGGWVGRHWRVFISNKTVVQSSGDLSDWLVTLVSRDLCCHGNSYAPRMSNSGRRRQDSYSIVSLNIYIATHQGQTIPLLSSFFASVSLSPFFSHTPSFSQSESESKSAS